MGDRSALTEFWERRSHEPTVETMMLNMLAQKVDLQDKQDVLNALPDYTNMRIIELGAGIGRITPILASKAKHVLAVDIVESFVETNRKNHEHMGNITFQTCEASKMEVPSSSVDLLFTNWLLMYLTDVEVIDLLRSALDWLDVDGFFHIRESCSEPSKRNMASCPPSAQTMSTDVNPTHYRHVCQYLALLDSIGVRDKIRNVNYKFEILWSKSVNAYVEVYGNWRQNQILVRKIIVDEPAAPHINGMIKELRLSIVEDDAILLKLLNGDPIVQNGELIESNHETIEKTPSPATRLMLEAIKSSMNKPRCVLNVSTNDKLDVCPFGIAKNLDARVDDLEASIYAYNCKLAKAVAKQDKRVRLYWTDMRRLGKSQNWSSFLQKQFDAILITQPKGPDGRLLATIAQAKKSLAPDGRIFAICEADDEKSINEIFKATSCEILGYRDISSGFCEEFEQKCERFAEKSRNSKACARSVFQGDKRWFITEAK